MALTLAVVIKTSMGTRRPHPDSACLNLGGPIWGCEAVVNVQEALPGREKPMIDSFIRRNTDNNYHFQQFLPGYTGPTFPWPASPAPKSAAKAPRGKSAAPWPPSQHHQGMAAPANIDLEDIRPLKLGFVGSSWTKEEQGKLTEGLRKYCRDIRRLQVSLHIHSLGVGSILPELWHNHCLFPPKELFMQKSDHSQRLSWVHIGLCCCNAQLKYLNPHPQFDKSTCRARSSSIRAFIPTSRASCEELLQFGWRRCMGRGLFLVLWY